MWAGPFNKPLEFGQCPRNLQQILPLHLVGIMVVSRNELLDESPMDLALLEPSENIVGSGNSAPVGFTLDPRNSSTRCLLLAIPRA